ncbi:saccharopine dehydrogenase [Necator americanus]|uniref:Saccharopine dehydrogenase n=1 Tax=Necator americanus TaxID=51031 RepID=W2SNG8_NECAM|nr:saccharopine dehydrogenase [Necator americanus]ETN70386.1 saccharopine dehydrogenase [Necator americanus]
MSRFDLVIYGASGFTGAYIVERLVTSKYYEGLNFAVAGRNQAKLQKVLDDVSKKTGKDIVSTPIIIADSADEHSLADMARRAKVIVNAVGPYRLYGEAVVKAAVENGASHVDISGEPAFLEQMQMLYGEKAKEKGVYVVGACGWDSIPCDMGVNFLKEKFDGDLNHVESFVQMTTGPSVIFFSFFFFFLSLFPLKFHTRPAANVTSRLSSFLTLKWTGYSLNDGTYQTLILGISGMKSDGLGRIRRSIMPEKIVKGTVKPPKRGPLWQIHEKELDGWALPFMGSDKSIVNRSQYYDAVNNGKRPVHIETYLRVSSLLWAVLLAAWLVIFALLAQFKFTRKILQKYPDICSFNIFKASGPTEQQIKEAGFIYWFFGYGYANHKPMTEQHLGNPDQRMVVSCKGPDAGYMATSACALSAALSVVRDSHSLPHGGGVFTTASAFAKTNIYSYLDSFGITFQVESAQSQV